MAIKDNDSGSWGRALTNPPKTPVSGTSTGNTNYNVSTDTTELPTGGSLTQNGGPVQNAVDKMGGFLSDIFGGYANNVYENVVGGGKDVVSSVSSVLDENKPLVYNAGWSAQGNGDEQQANIILPSAQEKAGFPIWLLALIPLILLIKKF